MEPRDSPYVQEFRNSLSDWTDERFVSRQQIGDMAMFIMYLVNLAEADGWQYDGHSWKRGSGMGCLTVRATKDAIPQVVFTSAQTLPNGIRIFLRKLEGDMLEWVPDRFRG